LVYRNIADNFEKRFCPIDFFLVSGDHMYAREKLSIFKTN